MKKVTFICEEKMTLADLIRYNSFTVQALSEAINVDAYQVMEWICGKVPASEDCVKLSQAMGCPISMVYTALINTPCVISLPQP